MGLASKVQNAGGASALASASTATAPAASASSQSAGYPQINQGMPNGTSQRPALPGPSGPTQSGGQGFPGQPLGARPSLAPQLSFQPQQQQQQRPMLQQSASFQGFPSQPGMPGQGQQTQYGMQGQGQQSRPQQYGQPGMPQQGYQHSPSFNTNSYGSGAPPSQYNQLQLTAPPARPSAPPMQSQYGPRPGAANVQPGLQQKLEGMIRTNRLEAFYPGQKLQQVLQRLSNIDFT